jgi:hypothetical protein
MKTASRVQPAAPVRSSAGTTSSDHSQSKSAAPSHDDIAWRAYLLWEARGCPQGTHLQDWLEAEKELKAGKK